MINMLENNYVAQSAIRFNEAQTAFNHAKEQLNFDLYAAFRQICHIKAGECISAKTDRGYLFGRAVIMRNGLSLGLYVQTNRGRFEVAKPYSQNAEKISTTLLRQKRRIKTYHTA